MENATDVSAYLDPMDGRTFVGKNGLSYRVLTRSIDRSEAKLDSQVFAGTPYAQTSNGQPYPWRAIRHNLEITREGEGVVGYADFREYPYGILLRAMEVRDDLQGQGFATGVLQSLRGRIRPGKILKFYSDNSQTNDALDRMVAEIQSGEPYRKVRAERGKAAAQVYLSAMLTIRVEARGSEEKILWPNVLRKAGFKDIRTEIEFGLTEESRTYHFIAEP